MQQKYHGSAGAGLLFICLEDKTVLFAKRAKEDVMEPGTWGIPGGKKNKNDNSSLYTAIRETLEEFTTIPEINDIVKKVVYKDGYFKYTTYFCVISKKEKEEWNPDLNWEHEMVEWFPLSELPDNLHFGLEHIKHKIKSLETL